MRLCNDDHNVHTPAPATVGTRLCADLPQGLQIQRLPAHKAPTYCTTQGPEPTPPPPHYCCNALHCPKGCSFNPCQHAKRQRTCTSQGPGPPSPPPYPCSNALHKPRAYKFNACWHARRPCTTPRKGLNLRRLARSDAPRHCICCKYTAREASVASAMPKGRAFHLLLGTTTPQATGLANGAFAPLTEPQRPK